MTGEPAPRPPLPLGAAAVGPLLALLLYAPTLSGSFLSDDFLINTMLTGDPPRVDWAVVLDDFVSPFAGLEDGGLYRPFVTLSIALNYALGGTDPFGYHLVNVLLTAIASLGGALTAAFLAPRRPGSAALFAGALVALHPTFGETTCWIVARNSGLQVAFATVAMAGFAAWLSGGRRRGLWVAGAGLLCALLTKETGVLLPGSFLALDLVRRGLRVPLRERRVHLFMFGVVLAYFALRRVVLGAFVGGGGAATIESAAPLATFLDKAWMLLCPRGSGLPAPWGLLCGALVVAGWALVLVPPLRQRAGRRTALVGAVWIVAHFAPTWRLAVLPGDLTGSRMIVGAAAVLAVLAGVLAAELPRRVAGAAAVVLAVGLAPLAAGRMAQFLHAYDDMGHLRGALTNAAEGAHPGRPLTVVAVTRNEGGIPFLNCNALFPLLERPIAAADTPMVSLGYVFQPVPDSENLLFDVGPWRALWELGSTTFEWHRAPGMPAPLTTVERRTPRPPEPLPQLRADGPGRFVASGPVDTFAVEALEVLVEGDCPGGRVEWLFFQGETPAEFATLAGIPAVFQAAPRAAPLQGGTPREGNTVFYVDVTRYLTLLSLKKLGGLAGFVVRPDRGRALAVRMLPRVDLLSLPRRLAGAAVPLDRTALHLIAPPLPEGATDMTLFLVGPDTTLSLPVAPGPVPFDDKLRKTIRIILRSSRQDRYYLYFTARGARAWRSPLDWVAFRPEGSR